MSDFRRLSEETEFSGISSDDGAFSHPHADGSFTHKRTATLPALPEFCSERCFSVHRPREITSQHPHPPGLHLQFHVAGSRYCNWPESGEYSE